MLYHERAGPDKAAKAGAARLVRAVLALASLLLPFLPLAGGYIPLTEKTARARSGVAVFYSPCGHRHKYC